MIKNLVWCPLENRDSLYRLASSLNVECRWSPALTKGIIQGNGNPDVDRNFKI